MLFFYYSYEKRNREKEYRVDIFSEIKFALQKTSEKISIMITRKKFDDLTKEIEDDLILVNAS